MIIDLQVSGLRNTIAILRRRPAVMKQLFKRGTARMAQVGINIIQERTKSGVGYKDGAFKPYSESYAAFRAEKGATLTPNLELSGNMLGAMTSKSDHKKAVIFFSSKDESEKAAHNNKTRPFFGFSRDEEKRLLKSFERFIR